MTIEEAAKTIHVHHTTIRKAIKELNRRGLLKLAKVKGRTKPATVITDADLEIIKANINFGRTKRVREPVKHSKPTYQQREQLHKFFHFYFMAKRLPDKPKDWFDKLFNSFCKGEI